MKSFFRSLLVTVLSIIGIWLLFAAVIALVVAALIYWMVGSAVLIAMMVWGEFKLLRAERAEKKANPYEPSDYIATLNGIVDPKPVGPPHWWRS